MLQRDQPPPGESAPSCRRADSFRLFGGSNLEAEITRAADAKQRQRVRRELGQRERLIEAQHLHDAASPVLVVRWARIIHRIRWLLVTMTAQYYLPHLGIGEPRPHH